MLTFDKIAKEIVDRHAIFFGRYGNKIPSSTLSFSANDYFKTIHKIQFLGDSHKDFKRIPTIDVLYRDFVDHTGNYGDFEEVNL